jgi:hypothetical protein
MCAKEFMHHVFELIIANHTIPIGVNFPQDIFPYLLISELLAHT